LEAKNGYWRRRRDNLVDLFDSITASSMDNGVKDFLIEAVVIEFDGKPLAAMDKLVEEHVGDSKH